MGLIQSRYKVYKKYSSCPFGRQCFSCEDVGHYAECPLTLEEKVYAEIAEGGYEGVTPYGLFRAVRVNG